MSDIRHFRWLNDGIPETIDIAASGTNVYAWNFKIASTAITANKPLMLNADKEFIAGDISLSDTTGTLPDSRLDQIVTPNKVAGSAVQLASGKGLKNSSGLAVEPEDIAGDGLEDNGADKLRIKLNGTTLSRGALGIKVATGGITSLEILDGTITNSEISSSAAILYSKLYIADGDLTIAKTSGLQLAIDGKLSLAGGTMSGNIAMALNKVTGLTPGTDNNDAVTYGQLQGAIAGLDFQNDAIDVQVDDTLDPGTPTTNDTYILTDVSELHVNFGTITKAWDGTSATLQDNDIVKYHSTGEFRIYYDVSVGGAGILIWVKNISSYYRWDGSNWDTFGGLSGVTDGVGLGKIGNLIYVKMGAGITELPSDYVGIDLASDPGLELTSLTESGQLRVKVDNLTIARDAVGIYVKDLGIGTDKLAALSITVAKLGSIVGNGLTGSNGSAIAALADPTGGANLAKVMNVSANGLAIKIDDSTIGENGSNQLFLKNSSITAEKLGAIAGNGLTGGSGSALAVLKDTTGGANLAKVINVSANGVAVKIDNESIGENGSGQLYVKSLGITNDMLAGSIPDTKLAEDYIKTSEVDNSSIYITGGNLTVKALGITNAMLAGSIADGKLAEDYIRVSEVDNSSIYINAGNLTVKALGITNAMLAGSIADTKLSQITTTNKVAGSAVQLATNGGIENSTGLKIKLDGSTLVLGADGISLNDPELYLKNNESSTIEDDVRYSYGTPQTFTNDNNLVTKGYVDGLSYFTSLQDVTFTHAAGKVPYSNGTAIVGLTPTAKRVIGFNDDATAIEVFAITNTTTTFNFDKSIIIGAGSAGVDYTLQFNGETSDGTITWMEDEARFDFDHAVKIDGIATFTNYQNIAEIAEPGGTPASGTGYLYVDTADSKIKFKNDAGTVFDLTASGGGGGTPGGNDTEVQFNDGSTFGGDAKFTWDKSTSTLTVDGKLTVTGLIDPTGIAFTTQSSNPFTTEKGMWINSSNGLRYFNGTTDKGVIAANITETQGQILYYNGTDWTALDAGDSGQFLKTQGAGANPMWDDAVTSIGQVDVDRKLTIATEGQTVFATTFNVNENVIMVFEETVKLIKDVSYTKTGAQEITLTVGATAGVRYEFLQFKVV
jgi:hypothetical protein